MSPPRLLLFAAALALSALLPVASSAHPATGIVVDAQGRVHFSDLETGFTPPNVFSGPRVRELSPDGTSKVLTTVGLEENVASRLTSSSDAGAAGDSCGRYVGNAARVERALGLYFGLGVIAIGAVAGLKGLGRRAGHA